MSNTDKVLKFLKKYGYIKPHMVYTHFGTMAVAQIISRLRKRGYEIIWDKDMHRYHLIKNVDPSGLE